MSGPAVSPAARLGRLLVLPVALGVVAIVLSAALGHVLIGLLITVGLALGALNGLLAERALSRLGIITVIALVIVVAARPDGWTVLVGLAVYQLISLAAALGVAKKEARTG
jgi:hypothetical protein